MVHGVHEDSKDAIDKMAQDVEAQIAKREKYSRRRMHDDDADIDYINERNKKFNKKLERFYNEYTKDIKDNLERGTAVWFYCFFYNILFHKTKLINYFFLNLVHLFSFQYYLIITLGKYTGFYLALMTQKRPHFKGGDRKVRCKQSRSKRRQFFVNRQIKARKFYQKAESNGL